MQYVIELPEDLKRMIIDEGRFEVAHAYRLAACVKEGVALPEHHVDCVETLVAASDEEKELKAHREAWNKLRNDVVAYHNNYDYDTAMHFLNIIDTRLSEIRGDSK